MAAFRRDQFAKRGDDAGVFLDDLGRALVVWTAMQDRHPVTVAEAAAAFNTSADVIHDAAGEAVWIDIEGPHDDPTKQRLELDGE